MTDPPTLVAESPAKKGVRYSVWVDAMVHLGPDKFYSARKLVLASRAGGDVRVLRGLGDSLANVVAVERNPEAAAEFARAFPTVELRVADLSDVTSSLVRAYTYVALLAVSSCGDNTYTTIYEAQAPAEAGTLPTPSPAPQDASQPSLEAGPTPSDAGAGEAEAQAPWTCAWPETTRPPSDRCWAWDEACTKCPAPGGFRYACPNGRPEALQGCVDDDEGGTTGVQISCCAAACVRYSGADYECPTSKSFAFACARSGPPGGPSALPTRKGCARLEDAGFQATELYCCP